MSLVDYIEDLDDLDDLDSVGSIDKEDVILNSTKRKKLSRSEYLRNPDLSWRWVQDFEKGRTPSEKRERQRTDLAELELKRSKHFEIYNILRTQLQIRPDFMNCQDIIMFIKDTQSLRKPRVSFNEKIVNLKSFQEIDIHKKQALIQIGERTFIFNAKPTCLFDVPRFSNLNDLRHNVMKTFRNESKHQRVIHTEIFIPELLFYVLYLTKEPPLFAKRMPTWEEKQKRKPGESYQSLNRLIEIFYPNYRDRIDFVSLQDCSIFHDLVLNKWLRFKFYPFMFDTVEHYSIRLKSHPPTNKTLLCCYDLHK